MSLNENDTEQDRGTLAKMVTHAFDLWKIDTDAQLSLLGLAASNRAELSRYRKGEPLADNPDLIQRVGHLLAIHKSLRQLFPQDRDLAYAWMTQINRAFDHRTPVGVIREQGLPGLQAVHTYLDHPGVS